MNDNPWKDLTPLTKRRVKGVHQHMIHWIADVQSRVGLMIQCKESSFKEHHLIKLKGIHVDLDTSESPNRLILLLNNNEDKSIFEVLCNDLITVAEENENEIDMISKIGKRLLRWKKLLQQELNVGLSLQKQMGLFGELLFINDLLEQDMKIEEAINGWHGPKYDKQDFVLDNSAIEVKTYSTSKEKYIEINSKEQLYSSKDNLFLVAYALSENSAGKSVRDLVEIISEKITLEETKEVFIDKIESYGYIPEIIDNPLHQFLVDESSYYTVGSEFPRITPSNLNAGIKKIKYTVDLNSCNSFKVEKNQLIV